MPIPSSSPQTVTLRNTNVDDLDIFYQQQLEPEAIAMAVFPSRDYEIFTQHWKNRILNNSDVLSRTVLAHGNVAGNIVCWEQDQKRWIGYWYGRDFWGRGIANTALKLFLPQAPWRPLYADPAATNIASIRVLEKCGFRQSTSHEAKSSTVDDGHVLLIKDDF